ncbi:hypothetical protein K469DRAFT_721298 [Zopfia rhizophila CBS 207.26]|uniref:Secreted protein n=1 Tax=Zopfia rhizophila CBS 207.26 TaxID=1314779 RepID=A0A6A6EJX1_9PEZI|nr:hypothetical protein K469DRAFT_721298 [Zopfia rhizophila CBS 207.26]
MASAQLSEPIVARSGSSIHSREEDEFIQQNEEYPLDVVSDYPEQPPSHAARTDPLSLENVQTHSDHPDEPPPPYEEPIADAPQIAPVEYSCDNSPQLIVSSNPEFPEPPPRNPARLGSNLPELSPIQPLGSPASPQDSILYPAPLHPRPLSSHSSPHSIPRRPVSSQDTGRTFSSAKAREAGFEIQPPSPGRRDSSTSLPSIILVPSTEPPKHTREPGKLTAYLIPYPKPRLQGVRVEDIPDRFLVYTPPAPPLSKPAPGEKEGHWHKTQRQWQEDVRKATMSKASKATWKGMKATATIVIGRGVSLTKTTNLEFLDRVSEGAITSTAEETTESTDSNTTTSPQPSPGLAPNGVELPPNCPLRTSSTTSLDKDTKPKTLEELTLIYPPSLPLNPEKIRTEFADSLLRTRDKSRRDAVVASSLLPLAAAIDASLIFTFGGLTEVSGVWAYSSIRGAMTSKKMTRGIVLGEEQAAEKEVEVRGCTCGHHEHDFGSPEAIVKGKGKAKKGSITLRMQQSNQLEILKRALDIACLKRDFHMFPHIHENAGDVNETVVLEAIGWQPTRRQGRDLEIEFNKGRIERLSPEQDEQWQIKEAKDDVRRIMKKGASEWVSWCKSFQKDPEGAMKK